MKLLLARTLQKSWRKILPEGPEGQPTQGQEPACVSTASAGTQQPSCESTEYFHSMFHTLGHDLSEKEICAWLASDQHDLGYTHFTDQDIISNIIQESTQQKSEESDDDDEGSPSISHSSAVKMFDKCLQWLQAQEEASMYNICMLQELRELAARKRKNALKQRKVSDFFSAGPS